jgi:glucose-6-phosphate 1-epimerase
VTQLAQTLGHALGHALVQGPDGLAYIDIRNDHVHACVGLQGAQVLKWQPQHAREPVLWLSNNARYGRGKSVRGGIPVCWPWFGPHANDKTLPAHGFARNLPWLMRDAQVRSDGSTALVLQLANAPVAGADGKSIAIERMWPHAFALELHVVVGTSLQLALHTRNSSPSDVWIGEALHTYFHVGEVSQALVRGLENREFADRVGGESRRKQAGPVRCEGEVDRVYFDDGPECIIDDPVLARRIRIRKSGSAATVVWSPGSEKARRLGDLGLAGDGREGWREMLCVETANALEACVRVPAGAEHRMSLEISVENREFGSEERTAR